MEIKRTSAVTGDFYLTRAVRHGHDGLYRVDDATVYGNRCYVILRDGGSHVRKHRKILPAGWLEYRDALVVFRELISKKKLRDVPCTYD